MLLVKTMFRTARECQPAIILIDECQKVTAFLTVTSNRAPTVMASLNMCHACRTAVPRRRCWT